MTKLVAASGPLHLIPREVDFEADTTTLACFPKGFEITLFALFIEHSCLLFMTFECITCTLSFSRIHFLI